MRHPLPYAFARSQQLLLEENLGELTLWLHPATPPTAVAEVMRKHPVRHVQSLGQRGQIGRAPSELQSLS